MGGREEFRPEASPCFDFLVASIHRPETVELAVTVQGQPILKAHEQRFAPARHLTNRNMRQIVDPGDQFGMKEMDLHRLVGHKDASESLSTLRFGAKAGTEPIGRCFHCGGATEAFSFDLRSLADHDGDSLR